MILVAANLLLHAYNRPSIATKRTRMARRGLVEIRPCVPRLGHDPGLSPNRNKSHAFEYPLSIEEAIPIVSDWFELQAVTILGTGERHWAVLSELLCQTQVRGPPVMDAHLAALAIEHCAVLCTSDRDLARFPKLRVLNPLEATS